MRSAISPLPVVIYPINEDGAFADAGIEIANGSPSFVEKQTTNFFIESLQFHAVIGFVSFRPQISHDSTQCLRFRYSCIVEVLDNLLMSGSR